MKKIVYLDISILEFSKIAMYEFRHDYIKPHYEEKAKLCYMDTDSFIVYIKTNIIPKDVDMRFDNSNYKLDTPFPKGKTNKVISLMKNKLGVKIMKDLLH